MSPTPCTRRPDPAPTAASGPRRAATGWIAATALLLTLAGCVRVHLVSDRELACVGQCRETKEGCDDDARWKYRQCETGYSAAQSDYRWCNAADRGKCGYPWWSCSENLYGYCTNRYWECRRSCRQPRGYTGH
jgi:hypothetical protein